VILSPENPPVEGEVTRIELEDEKPAQQIEEVALSIDERTETPDGNNGSSCTSCSALKCENRKLRNQVKSLQSRLRERRKDLRKTRSQAKDVEKQMAGEKATETEDSEVPHSDYEEHVELDGDEETEGEGDSQREYEDETGTATETETETEEEIEKSNKLLLAGTNLKTEPKHIVFLSQLLLLFQFCHVCKAENPELVAKQVGTEAVITTNCFNPKCPKKVNTWHSQPAMPNSQIPAGNFLLFMAVLLAGGSVTKVFQIFKHMGLCCVSLKTFFKYQQVSSGNLYIHRSSTEGS